MDIMRNNRQKYLFAPVAQYNKLGMVTVLQLRTCSFSSNKSQYFDDEDEEDLRSQAE